MARARSKPSDAANVCPVARAARLLGDTWSLLVLRDLAPGPKRFSELLASTGISPRVLSRRLHSLVQQGLLARRAFAQVPPRVEYALTEKGAAALPLVDALRSYGERWLPLPTRRSHG